MSRTAHKLMASGGKGYEIDSSLMFDIGNTSYLKRDYGSSANSYRTWTLSTWIKYDSTNYSGGTIWGSWDNSTQADTSYGWIGFYQDVLQVGGWTQNWRVTNRKFRDVSAWMHLVVAVDTTIADGSADNRIRIYINGVEETSFSTKNNPSQNTELPWNKNQQHRLGAINGSTAYYFGGYLAETQVIDGSQLTPSSFGETDSVTGQWIPKKYTGTYPGYSFYLPFKKNDRYSPYFTGSTTTGIAVADSTDWDFGSGDFTMEAWIYRHEDQGNAGYIMGQCDHASGANANTGAYLLVGSNNQPYCYAIDASNTNNYVTLTSSSHTIADNKWYHIAVSRNSSTWKLFLDGTAISTVTSSIAVNNVGDVFGVGKLGIYASGHWQGWISNARVVKGTAVYTSDFTPSTTPLTAVTNTVLLCCQDQNVTTDNSGTSKSLSVTAAQTYTQQMAPFTYDWYQDQSGQDNHYQADNITVNDVMLDTPTNNFATFNSLDSGSNITLSQGNLRSSGSGWGDTFSTIKIPHTGKWYIELYLVADGNLYFGLWTDNYTDTDAGQGYGTGKQFTHSGSVSGGSSGGYISGGTSTGDIVSMAVDCDAGKLYWAIDGTWGSSGNPATGANPGLTFTATDNYKINMAGASGHQTIINFGQDGTFNGTHTAQGNTDAAGRGNFYYAPPSGFKALCSKNLPTPTIKKSTEYFNTILYTGNDADDRTLTGVGHQPDLVWIKTRNASNYHQVVDAVRGVSKRLNTNTTSAEYSDSDPNNSLVAFTSDGFTIDDSAAYADLNASAHTYVAWNWKAGGSGSANNSGDINATVSANPTAGFSIVSWTGDGSNGNTVAHGLGKKPKIILMKDRENGSGPWYMVTEEIDGSQDYLSFSSTVAAAASTWGAPATDTISNWTYGANDIIAYVWAEIEGFSKFGSYRGNGESENGPYVYTGFSPALVIVKEASSAGGSWFMWDNKREVYNVRNTAMWADASNQDTAHAEYEIDFLSNGFKIRGNSAATNQDGETMLYLCWAEAPFKYSLAR